MSDQAALLAAIIAHPDDDTLRLAYADWLDEHLPDGVPAPAPGPSARAEYIRVQCRLARFPCDESDYPELLERQDDLADWLNAHTPAHEIDPEIPEGFVWYARFDGGEFRKFDRGFPAEVEYTEFADESEENIRTITAALPHLFARSTVRGLCMGEAYGEEIAGVLTDPAAAGLRTFDVAEIVDDEDAEAVRGIASSAHLSNLRGLRLDIGVDADDLKRLAKAQLPALESFTFDINRSVDLAVMGTARWFRGLRHLRLWLHGPDAFKKLADLPPMPNLVSLTVNGSSDPTAAAMRRFAASTSFPRLARFETDHRLTPDLVARFAAGEWPLRHLKLSGAPVQAVGATALAGAAFADTLRILELRDCGVTAGGVQALAASERLAGLKHLNLSGNPIGAGGLYALARSEHLCGLRALDLHRCNTSKARLHAATVLDFISALELPELRHLDLSYLPVCVRGARALASNATLARLSRLVLNECGLREQGARAIVEGSVFGDLVVLDMVGNGTGSGAAKLANPTVFPRLGRADLTNNRIPKGPLARLRKRPGVRV
jgi:uncharacterized protein (TIGR02996 family)